jgi:hypothetical protein
VANRARGRGASDAPRAGASFASPRTQGSPHVRTTRTSTPSTGPSPTVTRASQASIASFRHFQSMKARTCGGCHVAFSSRTKQ